MLAIERRQIAVGGHDGRRETSRSLTLVTDLTDWRTRMEGRTDFPRCLNSDELWALSSRRGGMMEAEEGRGTHERAGRNDAEGGLSPFSLQGRMRMVVGRFEFVNRARSPGSYFEIYRKPIWHLRIQRLKCSSRGGRSSRRFPNTYFCFKGLASHGSSECFSPVA